MSLFEQLCKTISSSPLFVQVALQGKWEDSWSISFEEGMPSIEEIDTYLKKGTEGIAFEVFFQTTLGYKCFLGVRFKEGLVVATPREFLIVSFQSIWSLRTIVEMASDLSKKLTGNPKTLFDIDPTSIELGVSNWWKSMGSIKIWTSAEGKVINKEILKKQLQASPHLLNNNNNYVAMEFNYEVIPHYWVALQVSDEKNGKWILNENFLEALLHNLLQISIV